MSRSSRNSAPLCPVATRRSAFPALISLEECPFAYESQQSRSVLVAGGAGFLGSNLCERFLRVGRGVLCVDNFVTGALLNVLHLTQSTSFILQRHDVSEPLEVSDISAVVNLACPASPVHYQADPVRTTLTS